jgi:hypothetical protein
MKIKMIAYGLVHFGVGSDVIKRFRQPIKEYSTLLSVHKGPVEDIEFQDQEIYVYFMLPCLCIILRDMNPTGVLKAKDILEVVPGSWRESIETRSEDFGLWSEANLMNKRRTKTLQKHHCRGVYYPYAKLMKLMWDELKVNEYCLYLEENERFRFEQNTRFIGKTFALTSKLMQNR